jgi:hypothetical protein
MGKPPEKIKVARDLPPPPVLTEEDLKRIHEESVDLCKKMRVWTKSIEMTPMEIAAMKGVLIK